MGNDFSILRRVTTFLYGRFLIGLPSRVVCVRFTCVLAEISSSTLLQEREAPITLPKSFSPFTIGQVSAATFVIRFRIIKDERSQSSQSP